MSIADNIKAISKARDLKQIEVATYIGVAKSAYSKIEKGMRSLTVEEMQKMARLFEMMVDQVLNYEEGTTPNEVRAEDKPDFEQLSLLNQLDEEDRQTVLRSSIPF